MADLLLDMRSDDKDVQRALKKMQQNYDKIIRQNVKLTEQVNRGTGAFKKTAKVQDNFLTSGIKQAAAMATSYVGVQTAVRFVSSAVGNLKKELAEAAETSETFNEKLIRGLTAAGDLAKLPELEKFLTNVQGATREQALTSFNAVRASAPELSRERVKGLVSQAARVTPTGIDPEKFSGLLGQVAKATPSLSPADAADLTLSVMQRAGRDAETFASKPVQRNISILREAGFSNERAISFALEASNKNIESRSLQQFAIASEGGRIDPEQLSKEGRSQFDLLDVQKIDQRAAQLRADVAGDFVGQQLDLLRRSGTGAEAIAGQQRATEQDRARRTLEDVGRERGRATAEVDTKLAAAGSAGALFAPLERFVTNRFIDLAQAFGADKPGLTGLALKQGTTGQVDPAFVSAAIKEAQIEAGRLAEKQLEQQQRTNALLEKVVGDRAAGNTAGAGRTLDENVRD